MSKGSVAGLVLALAMAGGGAFAYRQLTAVHPTPEELLALTGVVTRYPGATVYEDVQTPGERDLTSTSPASVRLTACSAEPSPKVRRWFDEQLTAAGWVHDDARLQTTDVWTREHREFELALLTQNAVESMHLSHGMPMSCRTGYTAVVR